MPYDLTYRVPLEKKLKLYTFPCIFILITLHCYTKLLLRTIITIGEGGRGRVGLRYIFPLLPVSFEGC